MTDTPVDLDKHRGMASQKATDIRRVLAEVEANAKVLRDRQGVLENQLLSSPAASWLEAAAKARYVLNLYAAGLAPTDFSRSLSDGSAVGYVLALPRAVPDKCRAARDLLPPWSASVAPLVETRGRAAIRRGGPSRWAMDGDGTVHLVPE